MSVGRPDPKGRFSNRVDDYLRGRPGYPAAVIPALVAHLGLDPSWTVADIGAGTGISAGLFLEHGCSVIAVEPNRAMREAMRLTLDRFPKLSVVEASAESTTLAPGSADLVFAAQAFHWFDKARFRAESLRIARPDGAAALMWNVREPEASPFAVAYEGLVREFATDYLTVRHENVSDDELSVYFGGPFRRHAFDNRQILDRDGLRARLTSSSYLPAAGDTRFPSMLEAIDRLFEAHSIQGVVELPYETRLYEGRLTP